MEVYELIGGAPRPLPPSGLAARGLTRFVGRDAELDTLSPTVLRRAPGGRPGRGPGRRGRGGQVAPLPRVSALTAPRGWLAARDRIDAPTATATAYLPVLDLLRALLPHRVARRRRGPVREKVTGKVLMLDRALEDAGPPGPGLARRPPRGSFPFARPRRPQRRERALRRSSALVLHESRVQPLVVVFEDLHWVAPRRSPPSTGGRERVLSPALLPVSYRPSHRTAGRAGPTTRRLRIDPLGARERRGSAGDALLGGGRQLGAGQAPPDPPHRGQPVLPRGVRAGPGGDSRPRWDPLAPIASRRRRADLQVPATVQAILAARIDRLDPEDKRLLQAAAVVGKDVPYPLLAAGRGRVARPPCGERLAHLQARSSCTRRALLRRGRVHVQARPHPRGRLRERARAIDAARSTRGSWSRSRAARRPCRRARRATRPPRLPRAALGPSGCVPPPGGGPRSRAVGEPRGGCLLRAGPGSARASARPNAPSGKRPSTSGSLFATPWCRWASSPRFEGTCRKPGTAPRRSVISPGSPEPCRCSASARGRSPSTRRQRRSASAPGRSPSAWRIGRPSRARTSTWR